MKARLKMKNGDIYDCEAQFMYRDRLHRVIFCNFGKHDNNSDKATSPTELYIDGADILNINIHQ